MIGVKKVSQRSARPFFIFLIALAVLIFLTLAEAGKARPEGGGETLFAKAFDPASWYQLSITWGHHSLRSDKVAVVVIGQDEPGEVQQDACKRRQFIAQLVESLATAKPRVIALDLYFDPRRCSEGEEARKAAEVLRRALTKVSAKVPIVFAPDTFNDSELAATRPARYAQARNSGFNSTQVILKDYVHVQDYNPGRITVGVGALNSDVRKIPLSWPAYDSLDSLGAPNQPARRDTFSVAVVRAYDSNFPGLEGVGALENSRPRPSEGAHPFTSFLYEDQLSINAASDLMCADPERVTTRAVSAPHCSDNPELRKLRDRVAVVGQVWPGQDVHESVIGAVPGVVLQANYIESLLDQRIFKPLDPWLQLLIGAVWLLLIAAPAFLWGEQPLMAVPLCLVAAIAPAWFMEAIVVARLHYYTELLFPSMAVVVLFIVDRLFDKIMEKMAAREPLGRGPQAAPQDKPRIREDL